MVLVFLALFSLGRVAVGVLPSCCKDVLEDSSVSGDISVDLARFLDFLF